MTQTHTMQPELLTTNHISANQMKFIQIMRFSERTVENNLLLSNFLFKNL